MANRSFLFAGSMLCLIGLLVAPAAAFAPEVPMTISENTRIDPGLKDELWTIHVDHRLEKYDANVRAAGEVVDALDSYSYDTTAVTGILNDIRGERDALADALEAQDRDALWDVNQNLLDLEKSFRQEVRQLLRGV